MTNHKIEVKKANFWKQSNKLKWKSETAIKSTKRRSQWWKQRLLKATKTTKLLPFLQLMVDPRLRIVVRDFQSTKPASCLPNWPSKRPYWKIASSSCWIESLWSWRVWRRNLESLKSTILREKQNKKTIPICLQRTKSCLNWTTNFKIDRDRSPETTSSTKRCLSTNTELPRPSASAKILSSRSSLSNA